MNENQVRFPFLQGNKSSTSLEGMERPVRSFKSFIETVPSNPSPPHSNKPLPPTPSPSKKIPSPLSSATIPPSSAHASSSNPWQAPTAWFNSSSSERNSPQVSPTLTSRLYSPLLPNLFPAENDNDMEIRAEYGETASPQLMPYECAYHDLGPPLEPPRSPLPIPPRSAAKIEEKSRAQNLHNEHPSYMEHSNIGNSNYALEQGDVRMALPAQSASSWASNAANKEKTIAPLGISRPAEQSTVEVHTTLSPVEIHVALQKSRSRRVLESKKRNPLADDNWEDLDMDSKDRQLSFSQDYHNLLADQYQEMSVRPEEALLNGPSYIESQNLGTNVSTNYAPNDQGLVPLPLTWKKESGTSTPRNTPQTRYETETLHTDGSSSRQKRASAKLQTWIPQRIGRGAKSVGLTHKVATFSFTPPLPHQEEAQESSASHVDPKLEPSPDWEVDKDLANDLRFSKFFPSKKPVRSGKKPSRRLNKSKAPTSAPFDSHQPPTQIIRLPLGLAVVRTPPRPPTSDIPGIVELSTAGDPLYSTSSSQQSTSPVSPRDNRSSYYSDYSQASNSRTNAACANFRNSVASALTNTTKSSHSPTSLSNISRKFSGDPDTAWRRPGFLEKARVARKRRDAQVKRDNLKKSIRVLGPTDPRVVEGYVRSEDHDERVMGTGRMPGYMVTGSI
jgi:hypothetical protein